MRQRDPKEPWLHEASGFWCKKVAGKLHYLDRDYRAAKRKLAAILRDQVRRKHGAHDWLDSPLTDLCDEFLEDTKARRAVVTYESYRYRLLRALKVLGTTVRVGEFSRLHMSKIEQAFNGKLSPTSVRDTLATVQSVFHWAVRNDILEVNPVAGFVKPAARRRNRIVTPEEFQTLLRALACNPPFRRVLIAIRRTGCRPGEVRSLRWSMVDLDAGFWTIPEHKTITTQREPRPRIVPLPSSIWSMCRWLHTQRIASSDHVFLNLRGRPYTKDRFVKIIDRARTKAGIERKHGEQLVLYSNRHTFATETVGKVSDIELAELMGHTSTQTTRRYTHFSASRLRDIQRRAQGDQR